MTNIVKKTIHAYWLCNAAGERVSDVVVVNETNDNICIGAEDASGIYQQYDSYEAYYVYEWATKHGFEANSKTVDIEINTMRDDDN